MWYKATNIHYHQQDDTLLCGEAVVQMMVASLGTEIPQQGTLGTQQLSPVALADCLNREFASAGPNPCFTVVVDADRSRAFRRIVNTLAEAKLGIPVSIGGGEHWVVVSGAAVDAENRINGFFVEDPNCNASPNKDHHRANDLCGTGSEYGTCALYVTRYGWERIYWNKPELWMNRRGYVTIVPAERAGNAAGPTPTRTDEGDAAGGAGQDAVQIVNAELDAVHRLREEGPLKDLLAGVVAAPYHGHPLMVALKQGMAPEMFQLDSYQSPYWAELRRTGTGEVVGVATVDPSAGKMLAVEIPCSNTAIPHLSDAEASYELALFSNVIGTYVDPQAIEERRFTVRSGSTAVAGFQRELVRIDVGPGTTLYLGHR